MVVAGLFKKLIEESKALMQKGCNVDSSYDKKRESILKQEEINEKIKKKKKKIKEEKEFKNKTTSNKKGA
jgi:hypothetical protein